MYDKLFSATNGLIEIDKSKFYAWTWQWRQGQKVIKQRNIKLDMKSQQLEQNDVNDSIRSLGVHIGPSLEWDAQFKVMKEKLLESVAKIKLMETYPSTAYVFFNMYLRRKVCFGCGITSINEKQEEELMKTH